MAEKPAGITGGDGTSEEQAYEVHNYDELNWCCTDDTAGTTVYIKLMNDIDCQEYDIDFLFNITLTHNVLFDLNNKTIKTFYIANGRCMFTASTYAFHMHDGNILNVYGYWDGQSDSIVSSGSGTNGNVLNLQNLSISVNMSKLHYILSTSNTSATLHTIRNCAFWITGMDKTMGCNGRIVAGNVQMTCCDFYLDNAAWYTDLFRGTVGTGQNITTPLSVLSNCRFQGSGTMSTISAGSVKSGSVTYYYYVLGSNTTFRNCVWDLNLTNSVTPTTTYLVQLTASNTSNTGLYNVDKWAEAVSMPPGYIAAHTEDMDMRENPQADITLRDMGFDVLKG